MPRDPSKKRTARTVLFHALLVLLGALIYGFSVQFFYVPAKLLSGGLTGISLILNRLFGLPVGIMIIAMNIPLFLIGWRKMGKEFLFLSLLGVLVSSLIIDIFQLTIPISHLLTDDRLLASAIGGALNGVGMGLCLAGGGSTGGIDILATLFNRQNEAVSTGRFIFVTDIVLISFGSFLFRDLLTGLYTAVAMYLSSLTLDAVLYGLKISSVVFIVTSEPESLAQSLMNGLDRGVTILDAKGAYTGAPNNMLVCAVARRQLTKLKLIAKATDPNSFIIISEAKEIVGNGFQPQK